MSAAIQEALQQADEIDRKIKEFFDTVNSALDWVPGWLSHLIQPIIDGMRWINQKVSEFWNKISEFLDNTGNPAKLEPYADQWRNVIGNPTGEIAGSLSEENLTAYVFWEGSGAEAYKALVPSQVDGLNKLKDLSIQLAEDLKELANGIEDFWIAVGIAFGSLIGGFVAIIIEACSIVAIPATIPTALAALGVATGFITTAIVNLKGIYDTIDTSQDSIKQKIVDLDTEWAKAAPAIQKKMETETEWKPQ